MIANLASPFPAIFACPCSASFAASCCTAAGWVLPLASACGGDLGPWQGAVVVAHMTVVAEEGACHDGMHQPRGKTRNTGGQEQQL
jgi:hypothetical protein